MTVTLDEKLKKLGSADRKTVEARVAAMIADEVDSPRRKKRGDVKPPRRQSR